MPVLPLTPLSLTASVNLYYLREAFIVLNNDHDFFIDCGSCSTISDGSAYAFDEAPDQPFVFWHEQCEEQLHLNPDEPMPIYFGVAKEDPNDQEILDVGTKILTFLGEKGFPCDWKGRDVTSAIMVHMNSHKPQKIEDEEEDQQEVRLYVPENDDTKEFCWNENDTGEGPEDGYYFYHKINDGESLRDAILRLNQTVWKHITHYQRCICIAEEGSTEDIEPIFEINESVGGFGVFPSLYDELTKGLES